LKHQQNDLTHVLHRPVEVTEDFFALESSYYAQIRPKPIHHEEIIMIATIRAIAAEKNLPMPDDE